ncbi:zinc finger, CCHC-type containing protein [Tanacetum coccineum]|uniref:Zinc finger, CCHC-type containing protein n=1 Tax=Tanacetum coccineum TaxID=301880 RepID=A0ABQ5C5F0_9ASTR
MVAAMKHMASNIVKLDKFEGVDFRRWQKKIHFLLSSMSVVYVLTTPMPENGEAKYMAEDASSKKFLVSNFTNYKMTDSRPVLEQYNELLGILGRFTQHKMNMDEFIQEELTLVELSSHLCIEESLKAQDNDKAKGNNVVGPSVVNMVEHNNSSRYNDNRGATVHVCKDRCWFKTYESLNDGSILHMENESTALVHGRGCVDLRFSSGKVVSLLNVLHVPNIRKNLVSSSMLNNCGYKQVIKSNKFILSKHDVFIGSGYLSNHMFMLNIVSDNIGSVFMPTFKLNNAILWHARLGHVHFKMMQDMFKDGLITTFDMETEKCKTCMLTKITKKPFQNVIRETKVLELIHNNSCDLHATPSLGNKKYFVTFIDNASRFCYVYLLHLKDEALDKLKVFKTEVELQQGSLIKRFETDRGDAIFDDNRFSSVSRPSRRSLVNETEDFGGLVVPKKVTDEDDPETSDKAMQSQDVTFWKEAINNVMNSIMGNNTWVLDDLPPGCKPLCCKWIFKQKLKVDGTVEKFKARVIGCLMYAITCTRPDIAFVVGKLSRYTSNPVLEYYIDASWISNAEDNLSTSGRVFLLGGGAISWASKKQTCITGSTMEYEFVALAAAGKEAEWLKNLLLEIPLWVKPITPISIRRDSAATVEKAYSHMYNGKSRHLGVRHNIICEMITNGDVSIEFVRSQQNLAYHLTKGLAIDLVIKSAERMGLKSN